MKNIIVLGGGFDQIALIQELRRFLHECYIILVDYLDNPIAKQYADIHIQESTLDKEKVMELAKSNRVDYVLTACTDQALLTMAYVSEKLSLPCYLTYKQSLELTNKSYMKDKMVSAGIPTSKHVYIDNLEESVIGLTYPLVVKPVDSNSSKGVKKVATEKALESALKDAFAYSTSKRVIIEEFKEGEELSVDAYIEHGIAKILSVTSSKKISDNHNNFTIVQSVYPAPIKYEETIILDIAQKIATEFALTNTPLLIQMIVKDSEYNVVEFSARMGGGTKYRFIQELSGVNIMREYVRLVMGVVPSIDPHKMCNNASMTYVYCSPGEYVELKNFDLVKAEALIEDYFEYKSPHACFEKAENSSDRVAGFLIKGQDKDEIEHKLKEVNEKIGVLNAEGKDIMRHDIY